MYVYVYMYINSCIQHHTDCVVFIYLGSMIYHARKHTHTNIYEKGAMNFKESLKWYMEVVVVRRWKVIIIILKIKKYNESKKSLLQPYNFLHF